MMIRSQRGGLGRAIRLHDLFALMLAACVAIIAIAAAVALLDGAAPHAAASESASQDENTSFGARDAAQLGARATRHAPATRGKHR